MDYVLSGAKWGPAGLGSSGGTITYSFATARYGNEPIEYSAPLSVPFQSEVREAFATWSSVAEIEFVEVADGPNSQVRLGWEAIDGRMNVLAETIWAHRGGQIQQAWIGFDEGEAWSPSDTGFSLGRRVKFDAVAMHEIGHAIGLDHNVIAPAVMNARAGVNTLQAPDAAGAAALYGPQDGAPPAVQSAMVGGPKSIEAGALAGDLGFDFHRLSVSENLRPEDALATALEIASRPGFQEWLEARLGPEDGEALETAWALTANVAARDPDADGAEAVLAAFDDFAVPKLDEWFFS